MNAIDESLLPLFVRADREGLWFYSPYQRLWFSPNELRVYLDDGRFRWGAVNWVLRDPHEALAEARAAVRNAEKEVAAIEARMRT